jgi:hypothetical protein
MQANPPIRNIDTMNLSLSLALRNIDGIEKKSRIIRIAPRKCVITFPVSLCFKFRSLTICEIPRKIRILDIVCRSMLDYDNLIVCICTGIRTWWKYTCFPSASSRVFRGLGRR